MSSRPTSTQYPGALGTSDRMCLSSPVPHASDSASRRRFRQSLIGRSLPIREARPDTCGAPMEPLRLSGAVTRPTGPPTSVGESGYVHPLSWPCAKIRERARAFEGGEMVTSAGVVRTLCGATLLASLLVSVTSISNVTSAVSRERRCRGPPAARCSRPTTSGTRTSPTCRSTRTPRSGWPAWTPPTTNLHPDFGPSGDPSNPYGMPYTVVPSGHPFVNVSFQYASESDPGPYPFGADTPIEGGQDATGDDTHSWSTRPRARSTSSTTRNTARPDRLPDRERFGTCARTHSGRPVGPRPMRPACRSCPASFAMTRCSPGA